jgi:hypothetical protein
VAAPVSFSGWFGLDPKLWLPAGLSHLANIPHAYQRPATGTDN